MKTKKRLSIRSKIQIMVMAIIVVALLITSTVSVISMLRIRSQAKDILKARMERNLSNTVVNKATLANAELLRYAEYTTALSDYISELYQSPEKYKPREVLPPQPLDNNKEVMKRYLATREISYEDVKDEIGLLGNAEQIFVPVYNSDISNIVAIYLSTESGIQISYDADSEMTANSDGSEVYYNYYGRVWYDLAREKGQVCFTDVYMDDYNRGMMITCAAPIYSELGEFKGVVCMDMLIDDLYSAIVDFDVLAGDGDYAFIVDGKGYAVLPKYKDLNIRDDKEMNEELIEAIMSGETGVTYSEISDCYFAYSPIESTNWKLCIRVPQSMILEPVQDMSSKILTSMVWFILIFILVVFMITAIVRSFALNFTEPLFALRKDAEEISNGNLEHVAKIYSNDEIGDLAVSFNNMAISLKDYIANLTAMTAEKERIGAELSVATKIQEDMLPRKFPAFPDRNEFDLHATMDPAKEVGGDFYDFFLLDDDHIVLVMADVSGKGVPAALFMVIAKTLIKNRAFMGGSPSEILEYTNEQLCSSNDSEMFVTVWLAIIEISTGKGIAANAGHEHPVIKRAGGDYELVEYRHSPAVATIEGLHFKEHEFELHPGDNIFVYTDGVPEATNAENELFGNERMLEALNRNKDSNSAEILDNMKLAIDEFVGEAPQFDDITMLAFRYFGKQ